MLGLKTASSEDLIKARVDTPGGGLQASRVGMGGRPSELELPEAAAPRNCSEAGRMGGWAETIPLSFSGLSHPLAVPGVHSLTFSSITSLIVLILSLS